MLASQAHRKPTTADPAPLRIGEEEKRYHRAWFEALRQYAQQGGIVALVSAEIPHEVLRAMDIPYIVSQWWASICASRQRARRYFTALRKRGYAQDLCHYGSLTLASLLDPEDPPWGGLPRIGILVGRHATGSEVKIWQLMGHALGEVPLYLFDRTAPRSDPGPWWEAVGTQWEKVFEPERLDLMVAQMQELIAFLEHHTGKRFDRAKFDAIMERSNQQAMWNRKTRDVLASSRPTPVGLAEVISAVMIPQWHRGSEWAVARARALYETVARRVQDASAAGAPSERLRLMWLGRAPWFGLRWYAQLEQEYGAKFVWSIYLAMAADAYLRLGSDTLRACASRYVGMEDFLHTPPWNTAWFVQQARQFGVDGVVHMVSAGVQGASGRYLIQQAFAQAGIPFLEVTGDAVNDEVWEAGGPEEQVRQFVRALR
ncbi:MAG: 2-hydroxyacyl-CoA dehydratase family protein [Firmicutes bacterium]|nr:2-hydroxyacyl-CoA dehydratase [Alicyclobacillaceae bacterium]MCL6498293.1 2-hydroxyacyl-CoA dehydratase family protein [Bacillota bacterium]